MGIRLSSQYYVCVISVERDEGSEGKGDTVSVIEGALSFRSYILPLLFFNSPSPPKKWRKEREEADTMRAGCTHGSHTHSTPDATVAHLQQHH